MLCIDSTWLHTIRPGQWRKCIRECYAQHLVRKSVVACPLLTLDQNRKKAADTAHQPNARCARVKWISWIHRAFWKFNYPVLFSKAFIWTHLVPQKDDTQILRMFSFYVLNTAPLWGDYDQGNKGFKKACLSTSQAVIHSVFWEACWISGLPVSP